MAARFAVADWACGARRAPNRAARRALLALGVALQLGLVVLASQALARSAAVHRAQTGSPPAPWAPEQEAPPAPPLPSDGPQDPGSPFSPDPEPQSQPAAPEAPTAPPSGRIAETSAADAPAQRAITVIATAYCPCALCCGDDADGYTAIMRDAWHHRGIAVDPALIPYRTLLTVPGYGTAMVDDTGQAMRRDGARGVVHIDLRFRSHAQAQAWGVRRLTIAVPAECRAAALATPAGDDATVAADLR